MMFKRGFTNTFLSSLTTMQSKNKFCVGVKQLALLGIFGMLADVIRLIRLCVVVKCGQK